jgi:hypothetical protein
VLPVQVASGAGSAEVSDTGESATGVSCLGERRVTLPHSRCHALGAVFPDSAPVPAGAPVGRGARRSVILRLGYQLGPSMQPLSASGPGAPQAMEGCVVRRGMATAILRYIPPYFGIWSNHIAHGRTWESTPTGCLMEAAALLFEAAKELAYSLDDPE